MNQLTGKTAIVAGASRGLGRGVTEAFLEAGARVVALARDTSPLAELSEHTPLLQLEAADASDPMVAGRLLERDQPDILALIAGAAPLPRPLHPGSKIIVMSSGAALRGSPLSGGYSGAKATQRFLADYAAQESRRNGLGIAVQAVLPQLTPLTDLGRPAVAAYAAWSGISEEEYQAQLGEPLTPQMAGTAFVQLAAGTPETDTLSYQLTAGGLQPLPS